jgi:hypothetical protein
MRKVRVDNLGDQRHTFATGKPGLGVADAREGELSPARETTGLPSDQHSFDNRILTEGAIIGNRPAAPSALRT